MAEPVRGYGFGGAPMRGYGFGGAPNEESEEDDSSFVAEVFGWILYQLATGMSYLVSLMIGVLMVVIKYPEDQALLDRELVKTGWMIVRDVCNNFFIIILMVIAVATILRIKTYHYKELLTQLLVMAVLINFSKMFVGIMVDFSTLLMHFFAGPLESLGEGVVLAALGLGELYKMSEEGGVSLDDFGDWTVIKSLIFALILSVVALVVIACIVIILVYRIVMLWLLTILSPAAFLLTTFPQGKKYAGQWWDNFTKNLVVGPVMLFFLYLSFTAGAVDLNKPRSSDADGGQITNNIVQRSESKGQKLTVKEDPNDLFDFLLIIGLLVGSLVMAQMTGAAGSKVAGKGISFLKNTARRIGTGAVKGTAKGAGAIGRGIDDRYRFREKTSRTAANMPLIRSLPFVGSALNKKTVQLGEATAKREQEKISNRAKSLKVDGKSESELRKLSKTGDRYGRLAATQALVKKGLIRDDDEKNKEENVDLINSTRKSLPPELKKTFDDNIRKYNPNLALHSEMYTDSEDGLKKDQFQSDVTTGNLDLSNLMRNIDEEGRDKIDKSFDSTAEFLLNQTKKAKDLSEINSSMSKEKRKEIWKKVDASTFKKGDGGVDEELRNKFLEGTKHAKFNEVFGENELEEKRKYFQKNKRDVIANVNDPEELKTLVKDAADLFDEKDIKDLKNKGKEAAKNVEEGLADSLSNLELNTNDSELKKQITTKIENALLGGADISSSISGDNKDEFKPFLKGALTGRKKEAISKNINPNNLNSSFVQSASQFWSPEDFKKISKANPQAGKKYQKSIVEAIKEESGKGDGSDPEQLKKMIKHAFSAKADLSDLRSNTRSFNENFPEAVKSLSAEEISSQEQGNLNEEQLEMLANYGDISSIKGIFALPDANISLARELAEKIKEAAEDKNDLNKNSRYQTLKQAGLIDE